MSSLRQLKTMLELANTVYNTSLTETSPQLDYPALKSHQCASLSKMQTLEQELREGVSIQRQIFRSTHAFLADPQGSGKTRVALAHAAAMKTAATYTPTRLHPASTPECFSISEVEDPPFRLYSNLFVVPHTLYSQWESEFQHFPALKPLFLRTIKCIESNTLFDALETADCVLISNTLYPAFVTICKNKDLDICWRRVFYDEADTIRIPSSCTPMKTQFTWFITSSIFSFFFVNSIIHSHNVRNISEEECAYYHPHLQQLLRDHIQPSTVVTYYKVVSAAFFQSFLLNQHPLRHICVVRCNADYVEKSIELPPITNTTIICQSTPLLLREGTLPNDIWQLIQAGNYKAAYTTLCLQKAEQPLSDRIKEFLNDTCPVCFDGYSWPILTSCCKRPFCAHCYFRCLTSSVYCPVCRDAVEIQAIRYIETPQYSINADSATRPPARVDAVLQILRENPRAQIVLYARQEFYFQMIVSQLKTLPFPVRVGYLKGSKTTVAAQLRDFRTGTINLLLLSPYSNIQGIGIPDATHLIVYHPLREHEKHHILHRIYRLGRTKPLQVYTLQSESAFTSLN